jgi:D-alanyl-D-alanine dipeptidase
MNLKDAIVPLNAFVEEFPLAIELVYAQPRNSNNHFANLYGSAADTLWLHERLAVVALVAAVLAQRIGWTLEFWDGLRPVEAQQKMVSYGYDPRLVSLPGEGAHPRGMAIDVVARDPDGSLVDMGTPFDHFVESADLDAGRNPAARDFTGGWTGDEMADKAITGNRRQLETLFLRAGQLCGEPILPLPEEWWDFRLPREVWSPLPALSEADLYPCQHLTSAAAPAWTAIAPDLPASIRAAVERTRAAVREKLGQIDLL